MNRRSFLALLGSTAAAIAMERKLGAFAPPRMTGGDLDLQRGLWTPDAPDTRVLPAVIDLASVMTVKQAAEILMAEIDARLPRSYARQVIVTAEGDGLQIGDIVLAADLRQPARAIKLSRLDPWSQVAARGDTRVAAEQAQVLTTIDAGPVVLDRQLYVDGAFSLRAIHAMTSDAEARTALTHAMLRPAGALLAQNILQHRINTFGSPAIHPADHATWDEVAVVQSRTSHLAVKALRVLVGDAHEFRFLILGTEA